MIRRPDLDAVVTSQLKGAGMLVGSAGASLINKAVREIATGMAKHAFDVINKANGEGKFVCVQFRQMNDIQHLRGQAFYFEFTADKPDEPADAPAAPTE